MAWVYLMIAGVFEIAWAVGLKYTEGFSRFWPSVLTIAAMIACYPFIALAFRTIPIGTGYAVWTGMGVVGTTIWGIAVFGEAMDPWRMIFIGLILVGMVGLKTVAA